MTDQDATPNVPSEGDEPVDDFWSDLEDGADLTLAEQNVSPDQIITVSTPAGQMLNIVAENPISIRELLTNSQLSLAPNATFLVDGTFVDMDHEVAPGGHIVVSVPLKGG